MSESESRRLFRKLTVENWRAHDGTADQIVNIKPDGSTSEISDDQWAALILETELSTRVPEDIRNLFEVAQGVLCYGAMFYPLYTLGSEQLYRVFEAALQHKCTQLSSPPNVQTFSQALSWIQARGLLLEKRYNQWEAARHLRNMANHADRQSICDPTMAVGNLRIASELIDGLFE